MRTKFYTRQDIDQILNSRRWNYCLESISSKLEKFLVCTRNNPDEYIGQFVEIKQDTFIFEWIL